MGITAAQELSIRQALANTVGGIAAAGFVIPTPLYCNGVEDFWATLDSSVDTKCEIEQTPIAACWIYPLHFVDDFTSGGEDSPLINLTYEFYLFRQYGLEREDENDPPEIFNSQVLKAHNLFVEAWLETKSEFQGKRSIAGIDPAVFAKAQTTSIVQPELIQNLAVCEFVPGIVGYAVKMHETVKILLREC